MRRLLVVFLFTVVPLALVSCSSDGGSDSDSNGETTSDAGDQGESDAAGGSETDLSNGDDGSSSTGDATGGDGTPQTCQELATALCERAADQCADSLGNFAVKVGDADPASYVRESQCPPAPPISVANCENAGDSARRSCWESVKSGECESDVVFVVDDRCSFGN